MKSLLAVAALLVAGSSALAQTPAPSTNYYRVRVMSADPWFVKAMLEGVAVDQPELSTLLGFAGVPDQESSLLSGLLGGKGKIIVDPTDNSLIFVVKS